MKKIAVILGIVALVAAVTVSCKKNNPQDTPRHAVEYFYNCFLAGDTDSAMEVLDADTATKETYKSMYNDKKEKDTYNPLISYKILSEGSEADGAATVGVHRKYKDGTENDADLRLVKKGNKWYIDPSTK